MPISDDMADAFDKGIMSYINDRHQRAERMLMLDRDVACKRAIIIYLPEWVAWLRRLPNQTKRNIVGGAMIGFSLSVMTYLLTLA